MSQAPIARQWLAAIGVPIGLLAIGGGLIAVFQYLEPFDAAGNNIASLVSMGLAIIGAIMFTLVWAPVWSRTARKAFGLTCLAIVVGLLSYFRLEGVDGDLRVRLVPRWRPRHDATLTALGDQAPASVVDLSATTEHDSPQFLGPDRNGSLPDPGLATDWTSQPPKLLWRKEIGAGWSSFAAVGNYAVTLEQRGEQELTVCYRIDNGETVWSHKEATRFAETIELGGPGPRSTPTIHEGRVYSLGAKGILNCLDGSNGQTIWKHDLLAEFGGALPMYAMPCSPLVVDGLVICSTSGGKDDASLVAFDEKTGKLVWKSGSGVLSYSSPTLLTIGGQRQIVKVNAASVTGYDLDGTVLWDYPWPESGDQPTVSQPVLVADNELFVSKGYTVGCMLLAISKSAEPADAAGNHKWSVQRKWANTNLKTKFSSAVSSDGYIYGFNDPMLTCLDPQTGETKWKSRGRPPYSFGQLLQVGKWLLVQTEQGQIALVAADPSKFQEVTRFTALTDKTWNVPVLVGSRLLLRNDREAACFELPLRSDTAPAR